MPVFQLMSDIHDEFRREPFIRKQDLHPEAEVLLLAGDITTATLAAKSLADISIPILYVLGNHEYYRKSLGAGVAIFEDKLEDYVNIKILDNETRIIGNTRVIGATLWTDFMVPVNGELVDTSFYCKRGMSDFDVIYGMDIHPWLETHRESLTYLKLMLSTPHDGPTIVMTHHAPSFKSSHPKYENTSQITGGFCSELDYVIEEYQPDYWVHGHCHESFDYKIGNTRVICNPGGYFPFDLNKDFNPQLIIRT